MEQFSNSELRRRARANLTGYFPQAVLVSFIISIFSNGGGGVDRRLRAASAAHDICGHSDGGDRRADRGVHRRGAQHFCVSDSGGGKEPLLHGEPRDGTLGRRRESVLGLRFRALSERGEDHVPHESESDSLDVSSDSAGHLQGLRVCHDPLYPGGESGDFLQRRVPLKPQDDGRQEA